MPVKLSQSYVRELFDYDPETGKFTWRTRNPRSHIAVGDPAGSATNKGDQVMVGKYRYKVSILIWVWVYGHWPSGPPLELVDHIDRNPFNNRLNNLRLVSSKYNSWNHNRNVLNRSGFNGVSYHTATGKYKATITINYQKIYLGEFPTAELAAEARKQAETKYWNRHD